MKYYKKELMNHTEDQVHTKTMNKRKKSMQPKKRNQKMKKLPNKQRKIRITILLQLMEMPILPTCLKKLLTEVQPKLQFLKVLN